MSIEALQASDAGGVALPRWQRTGAPTWAVAALAYGGWIGLTLGYHALPWWVVPPIAVA